MTAERKLFWTLSANTVFGAGAGLALLFILTMEDGALSTLVSNEELRLMLSLVFAGYFAVGSALTGFLFSVSE
jgi:hypothetical protein